MILRKFALLTVLLLASLQVQAKVVEAIIPSLYKSVVTHDLALLKSIPLSKETKTLREVLARQNGFNPHEEFVLKGSIRSANARTVTISGLHENGRSYITVSLIGRVPPMSSRAEASHPFLEALFDGFNRAWKGNDPQAPHDITSWSWVALPQAEAGFLARVSIDLGAVSEKQVETFLNYLVQVWE